MTALHWGVKSSLLDYVRGMADGDILLDGGASEGGSGFVFPGNDDTGDGVLRFRGAVTLIGHGGMMRVVLHSPWLEQTPDGWRLSIQDPDASGARLAFAEVATRSAQPDGTIVGAGTVLTGAGADLFFGRYSEGTPLDDPAVHS